MFGGSFSLELIEASEGFISIGVSPDKSAKEAFKNEAGGHRFQRIPITEKRGRIQTSTVTVSVLVEPTNQELVLSPDDVEWYATRGSGPGGQNRNKTATCVVMTHKPSKLTVRCESERSQTQNRDIALKLLRAKLKTKQDDILAKQTNNIRSSQIGAGMRGDKRRTYREKDDICVDHVTEKKASLKRVLKGEIELLWL